ncbi:hypothetical protein [Nitratireductor sp. GCM10026969]|uniref:hypothetical protein n=1 Tax=Nitratireductor sp. GCM10026969 TaxID=3252645 RepID=UPI003610A980
MARPRTPYEKARIIGATDKHPERYRRSNAPSFSEPVGEPYDWLDANARDAWQEFAGNLPWLNRSHRCITAIASLLAGRMRAGTLTDSGASLLRLCLGSMGTTSADFSKVSWAPPEDDEDDIDDFYFT